MDDDDGMAEDLALERVGAGDQAATEFLQARTRVLEAEWERLHLSHWREWMYTALEIIIGLILFLIFAALVSAVYEARRADGLVIESFSAPPDLVQKGLMGTVLASKVLDRLTAMQNATNSSRAASSFSNVWTNDIKLAIPETGISLGELIRYLHGWLGHEMHLSGELYETAKGVALTVRLEGEPGRTFEGSEADLDTIMQRAAEAVFRRAQPYRYSIFLQNHARQAESIEVKKALAEGGPPNERAWADFGLAIFAESAGEHAQALTYVRRAQAENPDLPNSAAMLVDIATDLGHDEEALAFERRYIALLNGPGARELGPGAITSGRRVYGATIQEGLGAYRDAIADLETVDPGNGYQSQGPQVALDEALMHEASGARARLAAMDPAELALPIAGAPIPTQARAQAAIAVSDWEAAARVLENAEASAHETAAASKGRYNDGALRQVYLGPWLAYADAMLGERGKAAAIIKTLPADCHLCARIRARIAAREGRKDAAAWWFARAVAQAPSLPFAHADWGEMLLDRGDADAAIEEFKLANRKGPHFADPLEMWGEALIAKNRCDLALAKFEEANRYAPNWGRLHLKWGEALFWSGKKDDARKQFALAAGLDLAAADGRELANAPR